MEGFALIGNVSLTLILWALAMAITCLIVWGIIYGFYLLTIKTKKWLRLKLNVPEEEKKGGWDD